MSSAEKAEDIGQEEEDEDVEFPDINIGSHAFDLKFHPGRALLAVPLVDNRLQLYSTATVDHPENKLVREWKHHTAACRSVAYHPEGDILYCGSADKSLSVLDVETGQVHLHSKDAHNEPINCVHTYSERLFVSGDDEGGIKIWDIRQNQKCKPALKWAALESADYISAMWSMPKKKHLLVTSGDGFLSVYDMRKGTLYALSECMEDELLSIAVVQEKRIVTGSREGVLNIFNAPYYGDISDRFLGHPASIDTMGVLNDDVICTGSSDGLIRIVHINPNKLLGVLGDHDNFPIESIAFTAEKDVLASSAHSNVVKLWDVRYLRDIRLEDEEKDDSDDSDELDSDEYHNEEVGVETETKLSTVDDRKKTESGEESVDEDKESDSDERPQKSKSSRKYTITSEVPEGYFDELTEEKEETAVTTESILKARSAMNKKKKRGAITLFDAPPTKKARKKGRQGKKAKEKKGQIPSTNFFSGL